MHICFIIDNSLQLKQTSPNNISHIDTIKSTIETMLRTLTKAGIRRQNEMLHLFLTSHPNQPLSSFEHDQLHFQYQLKNIECKPITYPAETIEKALKEIGKFRVLTETQTLLGYREGTIYQPALIIFFTSKLSQRNASKIISNFHRYHMRSQYKFVINRICFPLRSEKHSSVLQTLKKQTQNDPQTKKLVDFVYKMNKGWLRNIYYQQGKDNPIDILIKDINSYQPTLCIDLKIEVDKSNFYTQILANSEVGFSNTFSDDCVKMELIPQKKRNQIPLPIFHKIRQTEINIEIEELQIPKYLIDFTKKVVFNFDHLNHEKYSIIQNSTVIRLQKELKRHNLSEETYPIYFKHENFFFLFAFLQISQTSPPTLIVHYPNPPFLSNIVKSIQTRKTVTDNKNIEIFLNNYLVKIPYFYLKFLYNYFLFSFGIKIPFDQKICTYEMKIHNRMVQTLNSHRQYIESLGQQNSKKHSEYTSKCCPIYGELGAYREYSKKISKIQRKKSLKSLIFTEFLEKINEFERELGIKNYLELSEERFEPITREIEKYSLKKDDQNFNENIMTTFGNPYKKKKKGEESFLTDDTPMPNEAEQMIPTNILNVEKTLIQTKLAVEKNIIDEQKKPQKKEKKPKKQIQILDFVNSQSGEKKILVPFNPVNLRNELYKENIKKLKLLYEKKK